jgi:hypothetical protein
MAEGGSSCVEYVVAVVVFLFLSREGVKRATKGQDGRGRENHCVSLGDHERRPLGMRHCYAGSLLVPSAADGNLLYGERRAKRQKERKKENINLHETLGPECL